MNALAAIETFKSGNKLILKTEKWLQYLALSRENKINLERIVSFADMPENYALDYVEKTLRLLETLQLSNHVKELTEEVLKWSEVSKGGVPFQRKKWHDAGFNLFVHNIGSSQIYLAESNEKDPVVALLIATHGLIGQYIRGEVTLETNKPLYGLIEEGLISQQDLAAVLEALNYCVIGAVNGSLYERIKPEITKIIDKILNNAFDAETDVKSRLCALRANSIQNGENFDAEYEKLFSENHLTLCFTDLLYKEQLWYVEAALFDFSLTEFVKIFLLIYNDIDLNKVRHISFENFMEGLYYEHENKKMVNIYKKRIIESYLKELTVENILSRTYPPNMHVTHKITIKDDTAFFDFAFSKASSELIDFCVEAEKADVLYEHAIVLLFDLFGFRRDQFDRFYEEQGYLKTMNQTLEYKKVILDYLVGGSIVDIGPGGGVIMDLIESRFPEKRVTGVDISQSVIDSLKKKKQLENHKWNVIFGDALNLNQYFPAGSADTIIFCSILHELYSYVEFEGRKFNIDTIAYALKNAFEVLPKGGRIIIRDGIMTEPVQQKRIIKFLSKDGLSFLERYVKDFKGREITYEIVGHNEVRMTVNDAMEFLYTFTWGEKSYVHEVNEQFGYFTPSDFKEFLYYLFKDRARIIEFRHYLQQGYTLALAQKVEIFNEAREEVALPDSTCLVVIEKNG